MIKVNVKETDGRIVSFEMSGHADFAEHGKDLVCAGASAVSFGAVNAIVELTGVTPEIRQEESGYLYVAFPALPEQEQDARIQLIVRSMLVSLRTIEESYGQYITITFKK